jgi:hypothetical protein
MKNKLTALTLLAALCGMSMTVANATEAKKPVVKKQAAAKAPVKHSTKAKTAVAVAGTAAAGAAGAKMAFNSDEADNEHEPDITGTTAWQVVCEHGHNFTMYGNVDDKRHIALRWKNRLSRLTRVQTTSGANRFENNKAGLLWIDIPTKGMLLDTRHGRPLANECTKSSITDFKKG